MIVGIDGNEANIKNRVGIGEYAYELLLEFAKVASNNLQFIIYLKSSPLSDMPKESKNWEYRIIGPRKFWTQFALPIDLYFHRKPSVFFSPSHYAPRFSLIPTAISIMDLSYIKYPKLFKKSDLYQLVNWTKYSARKASRIFTISLASKDDIIEEYKLPSHKVVVTYPGLKPIKAKKAKNSMGKYILFVGTLQPRKNIVRLVEAFSKIKDKYPDLKLLIVGKKGWLFDEILNSPKRFGVEDSVEFKDYVRDEDMPSFYKNAQCFVLPSLYEGFGLPVLEAMQNGCPCVLSNVSSLPEAGGNAALYVNPESSEDIAKKLNQVLSDEKLRTDMIKKGYQQIKKFSWEETAKETLTALEEIAKEES